MEMYQWDINHYHFNARRQNLPKIENLTSFKVMGS